MKPSFAINLTEEGVTLLHRTARGWMDVGHVAFSDPDLPAALDFLRSTAMGLSPKGLASKVVIPNSQILYARVAAPGPGREAQAAQIAAALEGRTPYAVEDLVFDWSGEGEAVEVAVVARETLAEAEAFAVEHRFNPVSFVAIPDEGFAHEPFFGTSGIAANILPEGQSVEPDHDLIQTVSRDLPRAEAPETEAEAAPEPVPPIMPETEMAPEVGEAAVPEPTPEPEPEPEPVAAPPEPEPAAPIAPARQEVPVPAEPAPAAVRSEPVRPAPRPAPDPAELSARGAERPQGNGLSAPAHPAAPARPAPPPVIEEEAPMAVDVPVEDEPLPVAADPRPAALPRNAGVTAPISPTAEDDLPPPLSNAALVAFASRRSAEAGAPPARKAAPALAGAPADVDSGAPALGAAIAGTKSAGKAPTVERPAGAKPPPKFSYDDPVPPPPRLPGDPPAATGVIAAKASKGLKNLGNLVTSPSIPAPKARKPAVVAKAQTINPSEGVQTGVSPDALAKGLGARPRPQSGKPKYLGLILTGILLLLLAVVAAWSSLYLTQSTPDEPPATAALEEGASAGVTASASDNGAVPTIDDEAAADGEEAIADATAEPPVATPGPDLTAAAAEPQPAAPPVAEPAPRTGLDSDLAEAGTPAGDEQDEIFLAGMDAAPNATDPMALAPPANRADTLPGAPMPPPPFGTVYQFDAEGRIVPTPEGIETPEGVLLIAGKPPVLPPQRPEAVTAAALATAPATPSPAPTQAEAPAADAALTPAETFAADPALADARPRTRPADLVPAAPAGGEDDASLAPAEDSRFASLRPRLRPAAILAAGENSRRAAEAASLAAQAAVAAATEAAVAEASADGSISPMAVAVSRVPAPRPRDLSRAVEAAVAAASQPAARAKAAEPQPSHEEADEEPETASAAPRIPTKASVAKQATYVNAINLSKVNLIGVYGTQSKRYALIRQSNGRYKKVRIGDSFDGGTVKAITASEVRYQKGGRLVTLAMPKG